MTPPLIFIYGFFFPIFLFPPPFALLLISCLGGEGGGKGVEGERLGFRFSLLVGMSMILGISTLLSVF